MEKAPERDTLYPQFMAEVETNCESLTLSLKSDHGSELQLKYVGNIFDVLRKFLPASGYTAKVDITPNVYEGGFKVWECTEVLIRYFMDEGRSMTWKDKTVLEIGCGHGLVSLALMKLYPDIAFHVLQDYNKDVLLYAIAPNFLLNGLKAESGKKAKLISGDWELTLAKSKDGEGESEVPGVKQMSGPSQFDFIIGSEIIYSPANYGKITALISNGLKDEKSIAIIASKWYYFGVGGSVDDFQKFCEKNHPELVYETLKIVAVKNKTKICIFSLKKKAGGGA
jgi:predicted nicotinamide N-methyase